MTEKEYIIATNLAKTRAALTIMRDVLRGEEYGIPDEDHQEIISLLCNAQEVMAEMSKTAPNSKGEENA